jgi:hypothetical protein
MITKIAKAVFLTAGISSTLMSCSKQEDVQPVATSTAVIPDAGTPAKVVNGRVVFANLTALNATHDALAKLGNSQAGVQALADWEKSLQFTSLRAVAKSEDSQLEALENKGIPTPAHNLMYKFGFPLSYASFLNPSGEYQVGNKIYWFHDGVKYQADSEQELASIKNDPSTAKVKLSAGSTKVDRKGALGGNANRTIADDDPYADNKYNKEFYITGESGSRRRTIFDINVFTDDRGTDYSGFFHFYYTSLNLQVKYEYYSNGNRKWYPQNGESFAWKTTGTFDATPSIPYKTGPGPAPTQTGTLNYQNTYSNGIAVITLASSNLATSTVDPYLNKGQIKWDFEINGTIEGYPVRDPRNIVGVANNPLW